MLYVFFGEDTFSSKEALDELKADTVEDTASVTLLDGNRLEVAQLALVADALPFWEQKRLVVVDGLLARFEVALSGKGRPERREGRRQGTDVDQLALRAKAFAEYFERLPATTILALIDGPLESQSRKPQKRNLLLPLLTGKATVRVFPSLSGSRLEGWIRRRVATLGCTLTPGAVRALMNFVGGNLWALVQELSKLAAYAHGRSIEEEDIRLLVSDARRANIFAMLDAMVHGQEAKALRFLQQLTDQGAPAPYLLFMITREFRQLLRVKELLAQGISETEAQRGAGIPSGYAFQQVLELAQVYTLAQLEGIYHRLLAVDISMKTGRLDEDTALTLLLMDLSRKGEEELRPRFGG